MHRLRQPEQMDAPGLAPQEHIEALAGLRRINKASRAVQSVLRPVLAMSRARMVSHLELLDVACGSADVPIGVTTSARQSGLTIALSLVDRSPTALATARRQAAEAGVAAATRALDALTQESPVADVVTCSLFLHHLDREDVVCLLRRLAAAARHLLVITDLRRSALGWLVAWLGCRVLSRSAIVRFDGPVSVRAAWTPRELTVMAAEAGLSSASVRPIWPWRMQLIWQKEDTA
jgi:2-polyprenyl-3-methyl-5-hydroxy-6-metoxy-1,4-benzoquinol methylase